MSSELEIDIAEIKDFFGLLGTAAKGDFKKELSLFMDGIGNEFLRILQDEIIRRKVMDSRILLSSFEKGSSDNIWELEEGGLVLEVGTNVSYASYVNDGHWTNPKGVDVRFVPGFWKGDRFMYDPGAKSGMVLKQHWVEGKHYFESSLKILEKILPGLLDVKLQQWIDEYFR